MLLNKYYDWQVIKELDFNYFDSLFFYAQKKEIEEKAFPFWKLAMITNALSHNSEEIVTFDKFLENIDETMHHKENKKSAKQMEEEYVKIAEQYKKQKGGMQHG